MASYTESYHTLKSMLITGKPMQNLPEASVSMRQFEFFSETYETDLPVTKTNKETPCRINADDSSIIENLRFTYPVILPSEINSNRAIILLHGLNERSWVKYLPWAERLATGLGRPVILFPISFHMNRSPADWSNPRLMSALLPQTRLRDKQNRSATFVNLALSMRLSDQPLRFFSSGRQSVSDLEKLIFSIQSGDHPLFKAGTGVDFFAYSIGAFLAQVMMLAYGDTFLSETRLLIFCGGGPFNRMNGVSKLIMDEHAFAILRSYYLRGFEKEINRHDNLRKYSGDHAVTQAFIAMTDPARMKDWRNDRFEKMRSRTSIIALRKDAVMPPEGIAEINNPKSTDILDFPFSYTHENPFPLKAEKHLVDLCFEKVFSAAISFLK